VSAHFDPWRVLGGNAKRNSKSGDRVTLEEWRSRMVRVRVIYERAYARAYG
jgi:hypothetical protein